MTVKKTKTFIAAIGLVLFGFVLGACGMNAKAEQTNKLELYEHTNYLGDMETYLLVDKTTGVNYIVINGNDYHSVSTAITPRLKADGSLYVSE